MAACFFLSVGCTQRDRGIPTGTVKGTVSIHGERLTLGNINLFSTATGIAAGIPLDTNGTFNIPGGIEIGTYQVTVTPPSAGGDGLGPAPAPAASSSKIPEKYRNQTTSDLQIEIKKGDNHIELDLK